MIAIIRQDENNEVTGWILAVDIDDARRQAQSVDRELAEELYVMNIPISTRMKLNSGYLLLVS